MRHAPPFEDEAYAAWELGELERAADLFQRAAEAESASAATRSPFALADQSFPFRVRAGFCLWDSGRFEEARPILREAILFDWKLARLWHDRHSSEKAFTRLLMEQTASAELDEFVSLWQQATRRGEELAYPFPSIVPNQKQLLAATMSLGYYDGCRQILGRLDQERLRRDHELSILKQQAERFCGQV